MVEWACSWLLLQAPLVLGAASHTGLQGRVGSSRPLRPPAGLPCFLAHPQAASLLPGVLSTPLSVHPSTPHPLGARPGLLLGVQAWQPRFLAAELGRGDPRP